MRQVLSGLPEACSQLLADVPAYEQRHEGADRGAVEPRGHLTQALVDCTRIELAVELLVDEVRDVV